jgi:hypothetical protein
MKKLTLFIIIVLIVQSTRSQVADSVVTDTNQEMYEFLMTRHQKQKKTGFILLGSGLLAAGVGILIAANDTDWWNDEYSGSQFTAGAVIYSVGALTALSSIPVLIVASGNKKKAQIYAQIGQHRIIDYHLNHSKAAAVGVKIQF